MEMEMGFQVQLKLPARTNLPGKHLHALAERALELSQHACAQQGAKSSARKSHGV